MMNIDGIRNALVVGNGGLGSEVIKILKNYDIRLKIMDHDRIEISNLNRQFFFNFEDKNRFKSQTIAKKINCEYFIMRVEDMDSAFLDDFDVVFSCLDSVASRMALNHLFINSKCPKLIDCGVEDMKCHVKRVTDMDSCLYCIKELYNAAQEPFLCTLSSLEIDVTCDNRKKYLSSVVFKIKETYFGSEQNNNLKCNFSALNLDRIYQEIVDLFNTKAPAHLKTDVFEVEGIFESIIPNICTINSICASYAVIMILENKNYDFVYYDGTSLPFTQRIKLEKSPSCFVCQKAMNFTRK